MIRMAYYDDLTGLYNTANFIRCVRERLEHTSDHYALAVLDINHFKFINEIFGFERGNRILQNIAQVLRKESATHELYARESADHFCLLYRYRTREQLQARLYGIMRELSAFSTREQPHCSIVISCGINLVEHDGEDVELLLDHAFLALNQAKGRHENTLNFYDRELHQRQNHLNELEGRMYEALAAGEFLVHLQPQYSLQSGRITGAEALVRWQPPSGAMIPPDTFIPLFERNGFIVELDRYVLQQVCMLLKRWNKQGYPPIPVSVNQSRTHLYQWNN